MLNRRPWLFTLILFLLVAPVAAAGGPFLDLTIEEALTRAKTGEKLVFIDFYATWCGPCKKLDSTTFADEKVAEWLGEHTIPVKIDVDKQSDVAKKYKVRSMPTLVFLNSGGGEIQRIVGYRTSSQFLSAAVEVIENPGKDPVTRAREELETGHWPEAMARQKLAAALLAAGEKEEALTEYFKAMDSLGTDPLSRNFQVRLIHEVSGMARDYPPAKEKLIALRDRLVGLVESGEADKYDLDQIIAINDGIGQSDQTVELYERLSEMEGVSSKLMSGFAIRCRPALLEDRRYEELDAGDLRGLEIALANLESVERLRRAAAGDYSGMPEYSAQQTKKRFEGMTEEERASAAARSENHLVKRAGEQYQILLGVGKTDDAGTLAEKLLEISPLAETYHTLAANALRSGKATVADLEFAKKAVEQDRGEHPEYAETRDQLVEELGSVDEEPAGEAADQG